MSKPTKQRGILVSSPSGQCAGEDASLLPEPASRGKLAAQHRSASHSRIQFLNGTGSRWYATRPFIFAALLVALVICVVHLQWAGYTVPRKWMTQTVFGLDSSALTPEVRRAHGSPGSLEG